jgi:hypothetical protein
LIGEIGGGFVEGLDTDLRFALGDEITEAIYGKGVELQEQATYLMDRYLTDGQQTLLAVGGTIFGGVGAVKGIGILDKVEDLGDKIYASNLVEWAESLGWRKEQSLGGPIKYIDGNNIPRLTIKKGSDRTPGSGAPHIELRNDNGQRIDINGNLVLRKSPENHTPIIYDIQ